MKKAFKSALSLLLCMIMVVSAFPISTFAEEGTDVDSDLAYSTGNAMGKIVNNLALQESERKSDDYCIADTVFNGSTASVKYSAIADCKLIVAVFDEKSGKMIGSGNVDVTADNNEATVTVDCAVPSHYEVRSYLVDSDLSALSTEYRDIYHTSAFEEFTEATPEDYEGDEVIIFDEDESDFGVLDNNVISAETSEAMSFDYDEATLTYTFKNATDEVKSLSVGEVFYYEYGKSPDEFLLFKVKGISVDGSTVKIVEDENISLSDAFKFIRIDEDADFSQVDIDESELGECLSEIPSPQKAPAKQAIKDGKKTFSRGLKIAYTLGSDGPVKASIDGQMNVEISISTKLYYAPKLFGRDYCEFKTQTDFKTSYKITVSGKIGLDKTKCRIPIPSIPIGPFLLTLSIYPIADFTGSITLGADVNESYTYTFDSETQKMNKVKETEMLPNVEINEKIEFRLGVGVELKLSLATVLGFAVSGEGGAKGTVTAVTGLGLWLDKHHSCAVCFDGTAKKFVDIKLSFSIKIVPQILEFEFTALKWSAEEYLLDFYVSVSDSGLKYGLGKCPNIEYSVEITVLDKNSLPINEADVTCSTGKCDADGDGKFDDTSAQTDESGKVTFYLKQGSHSVTVRDAADEKTVDISIIANAKSVTVTLDNSTGGGAAPTPGIIDKLQYTLYNGEATITGCSESISGDIILPSTIYGAPVTKIERYAFSGRKGITSVILPSTVNIIDHYAFQNCSSLTSVNIPDSVTSIGSGAFYYCSSLTSVNIPDSVTSIGDSAFENTKIYNSASNWANGVLYINNALIKAKTSLSGSYSIKKRTKVIASRAFANCTDLTRVTIPDSVISIGGSAFYGCSSLSAILIPAGVNNIGSDAFTNCTVLNAINVVTANQVYSSIDGVLFNKSKTELLAYPAGKGTIYSIPSGTTSIGYDAFDGCKGLTSITIPNSVISIGYSAFEGCSSLTSITIPNSVTSISSEAFKDCSSLKSITIGDGVTSLSGFVFLVYSYWGNSSPAYPALETISIGNGVKSIPRSCFNGYGSLTSVTIGNSVTSIGDYAFRDCSRLTSITIPDSVTSISDWAFNNCRSLASITIPDSVTRIGSYAFSGCSSLTSVTIPNSVTSIGDYTFYGCSSLTSINIPDSIASIGSYAFRGCSSLTSIKIPKSVVRIDSSAFSSSGLASITVDSRNLEYSSVDGVLFNKNKTQLVTHPAGKGISYSIPNSVTRISSYAFCGCSSLTSITIPNSVTSIGYCAFEDCSSLTSVTIPDGVTRIDSSTFSGCSNLTSVTIPNSVTSIGSDAFEDCSSLTSVTIPDGVTIIGTYAFQNCSRLASIAIPASVTTIDYGAFYQSNLMVVYYSGTIEQWKNIKIDSSQDKNSPLIRAKIYYNSSVKPSNARAKKPAHTSSPKSAKNTIYTATAQNAVPGELYMLYAFSSGTDLSSLEYVAQLRAESSEVKFRYIPRNLDDLNVVIVGKFDGGSVQEPVEPEYGVERLELISPPAKTEYDYLSSPVVRLKGLRLKAVYSDSTEKEITDIKSITASKVDTSKLGDQEITLTYEGVSIQITVTVVPRKFKLVWIVDGNQTELTAAEGSKITKPADPELEGYDFMGWSPEVPETMPAQDMTFTAVFELRKYNATLVVDGKLYQIIEYTHGQQSIELPSVPEKEGYTGKWEDYTLAAGGVTINAVYTVNSYTVKWVVNGKETAESYDFGSKITKPAAPELDGYDFIGWSPEVPETMPAQDMTFTAVFEPIKTKISINTPSVTTVSYGFTLNLHANVTDLPEGARVVWSMDGSGFELIPSADGMTCGVKSVSKGSATITAKVVDKNGNEITASQQLASKAGFFQKLAAFFKKLFGSNMIIPYALEWIVK